MILCMNRHIGIILKRYHSCRLVLLDSVEGKITCATPKHQTFVVGSIISFFVISRKSYFSISEIQILDVPLQLARKHIVFLHHLLELCFYFLPLRNPAKKVFDLLMFFYKHADSFCTPLHKKIFLFKLFVSFGFYGGHAPLSVDLFHRLSSESIDSLVSSFIHLKLERSIDQWLLDCMQAHPLAKDFKTVRFLKQIGCYEKT